MTLTQLGVCNSFFCCKFDGVILNYDKLVSFSDLHEYRSILTCGWHRG